jgi:hypothetical protein
MRIFSIFVLLFVTSNQKDGGSTEPTAEYTFSMERGMRIMT